MSKQVPYYYLDAYLDVSKLIPQTPETEFEYTLYFNKENSLAYRDASLYPDPTQYYQYHQINPKSTVTDVAVYTNPVINQTDPETNVAFDQIAVTLLDDVTSTPPPNIDEAFLNLTVVKNKNNLGSMNLYCVAVDPSQTYAYFGSAGVVLKVNLATFTIVDKLSVFVPFTVTTTSPFTITYAAIDATGQYGYFIGQGGIVLKIDLESFTIAQYQALTTSSSSLFLQTAAFDSTQNLLYAISSSMSGPCTIYKIDATTLTVISTLVVVTGAINQCFTCFLYSNFLFLVIDASLRLYKVNLTSFTVDSSLVLNVGDGTRTSCVQGNFAYFGGTGNVLVKVQLNTSPPTRIIGISLTANIDAITSLVVTPSNLLYAFCTVSSPVGCGVREVNLGTFTQTSNSLAIDTNSDIRYFASVYVPLADRLITASTNDGDGTVLDSIKSLIPSPLNLDQSITSPRGIQNIDCGGAIDSTHTYGYWAGQPISASPYNNNYNYLPVIYKFDLANMELVDTLVLTMADKGRCGYILIDPTNTFLYVGIIESSVSVTSLLVKISVSPLARVGAITRLPNETFVAAAAIHPNGQYLYMTISNSTAANRKLQQIDLATFTRGPSVLTGSTLSISTLTNRNIAIDPTGNSLYLFAATKTLLQFDVSTATVSLQSSTVLSDFFLSSQVGLITPDGSRLYVRSSQVGTDRIREMDLTSGSPVFTNRSTRSLSFDEATIPFQGIMAPSATAYYIGANFFTTDPVGNIEILDGESFEVAAYKIPYPYYKTALYFAAQTVGTYAYGAQFTGGGFLRLNLSNALLSGLSTTAASNLVNTTEQVDVDYKSQMTKRVVNTPVAVNALKYVALYIRGRTGRVLNPNNYKIHTRIKIFN